MQQQHKQTQSERAIGFTISEAARNRELYGVRHNEDWTADVPRTVPGHEEQQLLCVYRTHAKVGTQATVRP